MIWRFWNVSLLSCNIECLLSSVCSLFRFCLHGFFNCFIKSLYFQCSFISRVVYLLYELWNSSVLSTISFISVMLFHLGCVGLWWRKKKESEKRKGMKKKERWEWKMWSFVRDEKDIKWEKKNDVVDNKIKNLSKSLLQFQFYPSGFVFFFFFLL